jgi:PKD repeat protein
MSGVANPVPIFNYTPTGLQVVFADVSQNDSAVTSWLWNFGDSNTSTTQNPTHAYAAAGSYNVTLTVYTANGDGFVTQPLALTLPLTQAEAQWPVQASWAPVPNFTYDATVLEVVFTDSSTTNNPPITAWAWDFGDGTGTSTEQNPTYTYAAPGTYTVTLSVSDDYEGTQTATMTQQITVSEANVVTAAFEFSSTDLEVTFTDQSSTTASGATIDLWHWDFGDGQVSDAQNPTHTYSSAGTYTVTLTAGDSQSNTNQVTQSVQIAEPSFSYTIDGLEVTFVDTSTTLHPPISAWAWNFGDSNTSNSQNPSHTYAAAGTYTVSLIITDYSGPQSAVTQSVTVAAPAPTPSPSPTPTPSPTPSPSPTPTPSPTPSPNPNDPSYVLKGFVGYSALANNTPDVVATLGELSTYSRTFSQDILLFGGSTGGNTPSSVDLSVFSSINAESVEVAVPSDYATTILTIVTWMYNQALAGTFTADPNVFIQAITSQYGSLINTITIDQMLSQGGAWLPGYVQFYFTNASTVAPSYTSESRIKLWFADQSFQSEYDLYTIAVVPPITNLDDFFDVATQVQTEVNAVTMPQTMAAIKTAENGKPYTILNTQIFNWMDPITAGNYIPTNWTYLIWGAAGNNIDAIKEALQQYILANSTHTQSEWAQIFPDIFTSTEFIITPLWTQYAIPNQTLVQGMYSPTVNPNQALVMAQDTAVGTEYTAQYVSNNINIVPTAYKAMAMTAVGNPQNDGGITEFAVRWPDYIDVPTTSTDFDRMSQSTQGFVTLLYQLLAAAEVMTETSDLPTGITRLTRTNSTTGDVVMYAVASYNNVDYLVVTKAFLVGKYGASTNTTASIGISYSGTFNNGAYQLLSSTPNMSLQFVANNANAPNTWTILDTTMSSASISETGLLSATFPEAGLYTITLQLVDSQAHSVTQTLTFNFQTPSTGGGTSLAFGTQNLPEATVGVSYQGTILITGGTVPYSISNQTMPPGLSATISGTEVIISGTPTQASGSQSGTTCVLGITDSTPNTPQATSIQFQLSVAAQGSSQVNVAQPTNLNVQIGTQYSGSCAITGGVAPYTLTTDTLPAGLNAAIVTNSVAISGTPIEQATGTFAATVEVTDSVGNHGTVNFNYNVNASN